MLCPISGSPITTVAELTTCGHVFDLQSLFQMCVVSDNLHCAVCRTPFDVSKVYCSPTLQRLLVGRSDIGTQTDGVITSDSSNQCSSDVFDSDDDSTRAVYGSDDIQDESDDDSDDDDVPPVGSFRTVDIVEDNYHNPQSRLFASMSKEDKDLIIYHNLKFGRLQHLFKYAYQSISDDTVAVAKTLARSGYLVYDFFFVRKTQNGLNLYMLYSADLKSNGIKHNLCVYQKKNIDA